MYYITYKCTLYLTDNKKPYKISTDRQQQQKSCRAFAPLVVLPPPAPPFTLLPFLFAKCIATLHYEISVTVCSYGVRSASGADGVVLVVHRDAVLGGVDQQPIQRRHLSLLVELRLALALLRRSHSLPGGCPIGYMDPIPSVIAWYFDCRVALTPGGCQIGYVHSLPAVIAWCFDCKITT